MRPIKSLSGCIPNCRRSNSLLAERGRAGTPGEMRPWHLRNRPTKRVNARPAKDLQVTLRPPAQTKWGYRYADRGAHLGRHGNDPRRTNRGVAGIMKSEYDRATLVPAQGEPSSKEATAERIERADDPITLAEACKLFPRAHLTVSTLRAERDRGRLNIFRLGRRDYTTEADMRAMVKSSKDESSRRVYASTTKADTGEQARSAAALSQITSALKRSA